MTEQGGKFAETNSEMLQILECIYIYIPTHIYELQVGIKIGRGKINNLRDAGDTTLMAES